MNYNNIIDKIVKIIAIYPFINNFTDKLTINSFTAAMVIGKARNFVEQYIFKILQIIIGFLRYEIIQVASSRLKYA